MYTCPVCGYDRLRFPADDYTICPSCGTKFSYSDITKTHLQLRNAWLAQGAHWRSTVIQPPPEWNPFEQLANLNKPEPVSETTFSTEGNVHWIGRIVSPDEARFFSQRIQRFDNLNDLIFAQASHA